MNKPDEVYRDESNGPAILRALRSARLFSGLGESEYSEIASLSRVKNVVKGQYLFHRNEKSYGFFIVHSGAINLHRIDSRGREVFRCGDSLAEGTLSGLVAYPADARAVEPSQVLVIDRIGFIRFMRMHPDMSLRIMESMGLGNRILVARLEGRQSLESEDRLVSWLLRELRRASPGAGSNILLEHPKRELAGELGITPETLSRALTRLHGKGLIVVRGRSITIPDPTALLQSCPPAQED